MSAAENVIGGLLVDSSAYWRIANLVVEQDFPKSLRPLFAYVRDSLSAGEKVDAITAWEAGHESAIDLASTVYSVANIEAYAKLVAEDGERSRVREAGQRISLAASYSEAQALLAEVRPQQVSKVKSVKDGLGEMVEALQRRYDADGTVTGIPTGVESLDLLTAGWQPTELVVVAGRPGMGKTAFALQAALTGVRTLYFSLEMSAGQLTERAVANIGQIPARWMKFPKDAPDHAMERITDASRKLSTFPLLIDDSPARTVDRIGAITRQLHMADPIGLVVVDHLGLVDRDHRNDASELGQVTKQLKRLAKELNTTVLLLCQLNRDLEKRPDKRPVMADLRDSGRIEEDADVVLALYRDEYYTPNGPLAGYLEMILRKNRSGEQATAWAKALLGQMRLESCDEPEQSIASAAANDGRGGFASRFSSRSQPRTLARAGGDD